MKTTISTQGRQTTIIMWTSRTVIFSVPMKFTNTSVNMAVLFIYYLHLIIYVHTVLGYYCTSFHAHGPTTIIFINSLCSRCKVWLNVQFVLDTSTADIFLWPFRNNDPLFLFTSSLIQARLLTMFIWRRLKYILKWYCLNVFTVAFGY